MDKDKLHQHYLQTDYTLDDYGITIYIDEQNPALDKLLAQHNVLHWAYVTAFNPYSEALDDTKNQMRHLRLLEVMNAEAYSYLPGKGIPADKNSEWEPETSVLILGISKKKAKQLGRQFEQNAIVFGERGKPAELIWLV